MVERDLMSNAAARGKELKQALEHLKTKSKYVGDVRGKGLLLAVELVEDQETKSAFAKDLNVAILFKKVLLLWKAK